MSESGLYRVVTALDRQEWVYAKSMPRFPHWYVMNFRWQGSDPSFLEVCEFIALPEHTWQRPFGRKLYTMFGWRGYRYWSMPGKTPEPIVINRAEMTQEEAELYDHFL